MSFSSIFYGSFNLGLVLIAFLSFSFAGESNNDKAISIVYLPILIFLLLPVWKPKLNAVCYSTFS
jgi:hypothetical protein